MKKIAYWLLIIFVFNFVPTIGYSDDDPIILTPDTKIVLPDGTEKILNDKFFLVHRFDIEKCLSDAKKLENCENTLDNLKEIVIPQSQKSSINPWTAALIGAAVGIAVGVGITIGIVKATK
jgi:hypothetical protein